MEKKPKEAAHPKSVVDIILSLSNNLSTAIQRLDQPILVFIIAISLILVIFVLTVQLLPATIPPIANVVLIIVGSLAFIAMILVFILLLQKNKSRENKNKKSSTTTVTQRDHVSSNDQEHIISPAHPTQQTLEEESRMTDDFDKLFNLLGKFPRFKFERLVNALLSRDELNLLPRPLNMINKVEFLGYMKEGGRLADVEAYIRKEYPELF